MPPAADVVPARLCITCRCQVCVCSCVFHMWHVLRQAATALWFVWLAAKRNGRSCRQTTAKRQRKARESERRNASEGSGRTGKLHFALVSLSAQPQSMQHKPRCNIRQKICIFICVQPRGAWVTLHATWHKKYEIFSQFNSPIAKGDFRRRA